MTVAAVHVVTGATQYEYHAAFLPAGATPQPSRAATMIPPTMTRWSFRRRRLPPCNRI